jgi:hypothetical protein
MVKQKRASTKPTAPGQSLPASWLIGAQLSTILILLLFVTSDKLVTKEYTVCSESNNIYTVDEANPRVECMLVRGAIIHDMGSFGIHVHHTSYLPLMFMQRILRDAGYNLRDTQAFSPGL